MEEQPLGVFKPNTKLLNGRRYCAKDDPNLNKWQRAHLNGEFDVYQPIPQADREHAQPLPPLAYQWAEDYKRRFVNERTRSS